MQNKTCINKQQNYYKIEVPFNIKQGSLKIATVKLTKKILLEKLLNGSYYKQKNKKFLINSMVNETNIKRKMLQLLKSSTLN